MNTFTSGSSSTSLWSAKAVNSIVRTASRSLSIGTENCSWIRPIGAASVMFWIVLVISSELGTISVDRSATWISVDRTLIRLTSPSWLPIRTQSPILTGRSASRISPDTKFCVIACRPKPMPTDSAPSTTASFSIPMPSAASAHSTAAMIPA